MNFNNNISSLLKDNFCKLKNIEKFYFKGERPKTWNDLLSDIIICKGKLEKLGFQKGQRIVIISGNSYKSIVLFLTSAFCGFVYVPIFPGYSKDYLVKVLKYINPKALFAEDFSKIKQLSVDIPLFDFKAEGYRNQTPSDIFASVFKNVDPEDTAAIYLTSGTTGDLKGVELSQKNIAHQMLSHEKLLALSLEDVIFSHLPWFHCYGGILELYSALFCGVEVHAISGGASDFDEFYSEFKQIKPTVVFSVPRIYRKLCETAKDNNELASVFHGKLRYVFSGGVSMPPATYSKLTDCGIRVYQGYGQTEASPGITCPDTSFAPVSGSVGFSLPGCDIKVSPNGELLVKGHNIMKGYWDLPDKTDVKIDKDGWLHTGDVCKIDKHGIYISGRTDDIIKLDNGKKVDALELEDRLCKLDTVVSAAIGEDGAENISAVLFLKKNELTCTDKDYLELQIQSINREIEWKYSKIKDVRLVFREPSLAMNELTPSMKLIRKNVFRNHYHNNPGNNEGIIRLI